MRRCGWAVAGLAVGLVLTPAAASASVIELGGQTPTKLVAPVCPPNVPAKECTIILTRVTALETVRDGIAYPTKVTRTGRIVAFSVGLSRLSKNRRTARSYIRFLDQQYGGTTRAAITVLAPVGPRTHRRWRVRAESPMYHLQPYLGQVIQIPLKTTLATRPGDVIALTTSTWVPVLSIDVATKRFAYRQSRTTNCALTPNTSAAQLKVGQVAFYGCNYPGTRIEYSATEVTNPIAINPIHEADTGP